ncbi:hypothetical protein M7I_4478 [Glarea lozoyensis 74030]|uniref:Uncharacterized protein n=1 Tax=Glarea lozoyensis (strain ATCC 74030 / MF5533) TaxID=1104152 RepID=H0EPA7_GLAL7|nr:hypothetical protein M7I_4478 [Glarea lozoyensis 74030]
MKFSFTLLGLLSSQAVASNVFKRACNADNCSRGIAGTNGSPPRTSRIADCSKLLATTITPSASVCINTNCDGDGDSNIDSIASTSTGSYLSNRPNSLQ